MMYFPPNSSDVGEIEKRNFVKLYLGQQSLLYSLKKQGVSLTVIPLL